VEHDYVSRRTGRAVPATSVTVALLEDNVPVAYGVVRDLSEIGACIMTDAVLKPGTTFQFRMSFFGGEVLEATARIIWSETPRPGARPSAEIPHGLEFTDIGDAHLQNLKRILETGAFGAKNDQ
jgi:hypothetical protein